VKNAQREKVVDPCVVSQRVVVHLHRATYLIIIIVINIGPLAHSLIIINMSPFVLSNIHSSASSVPRLAYAHVHLNPQNNAVPLLVHHTNLTLLFASVVLFISEVIDGDVINGVVGEL